MKRIFYAAAVLAVISGTSCTKDEDVAKEPQQDQEPERVTLQVSVPVTDSKATDTDGETDVSSLQAFVFMSEDGVIDAYGSGDSETLNVSCTTGKRDVVVYVNAPDMSKLSILKKSDLEGQITYLTDNAKGAYVMYGESSLDVTTSGSSVTVEVTRFVARVSISRITNNFTLSQYSNKLVIKSIFLINVAGDMDYTDSSVGPTVWLNQFKKTSEKSDLLETNDIDVSIGKGVAYIGKNYFYCYPNPTTKDSSSETWSPRYTRLVVEVTLDGKTYYYPISIPNIERNCTYEISELTLTKPGSESPDVPVTSGQASFSLKVTDWSKGTVEESTITI